LQLKISNDGHHWSFYAFNAAPGDKQLFEWWPSSAKLVINKQWKKGIHVHDLSQLIGVAENRLKSKLRELKAKNK